MGTVNKKSSTKAAAKRATPKTTIKAKPAAKPAPAKAKEKEKEKEKPKAAPVLAGARAKAARAEAARSAPVVEEPKKVIKNPYNKSQLLPLRQALLVLRSRVAGDMDKLSDEALRAGDPEVDADEVADLGSDAFERTMTLNLMENDARTLQMIDSALASMDAGRYGMCTNCGNPIPLPRLEALPFAQTCVPCQEEQEKYL